MMKNNKKELLFITRNRIGDAILTSGILAYFIKKYPGIKVTVVASPVSAPLFEHIPGLNKIHIIQRGKGKLRQQLYAALLACMKYWSIVVDCKGGIGCIVPAGKRYWRYPKTTSRRPRVEKYSRLIGLETIEKPKIFYTQKHLQTATRLLPLVQGSPIILIAPIANWSAKTWPSEHFIALIKKITAADSFLPNARIALSCAPEEQNKIKEITKALPNNSYVNLVEHNLNLLTVAACLKQCDLFIGNDSGIMHMAAAVGVPTLGLFGPTDKNIFAPYGEFCNTVSTSKSPDELMSKNKFDPFNCGSLMSSLTIDEVYNAAEKLWLKYKKETEKNKKAAEPIKI